MEAQPDDELEARDDPVNERFVIENDGHVAQLVYHKDPGRLIIEHTEVPEALAGRGIGGKLVQAAVAGAASEQRTVVPWCPYARRWLREHESVAGAVTIDWETGPPA